MTTPHSQANDDMDALNDALENGEAPQEPMQDKVQETPVAERLRQLEEENGKLRDQWIRAVAETDNVRKRAQRDQEETSRYAVSGFARDMVSVLENLKRAAEIIPADADKNPALSLPDLLKSLGEGVNLTLQELLGIFERHGIKRLDPLGEKFDHNLHQAVVQVERDDVPPGAVVQVVQAGYLLHDRLLQPAMVAVSKAGEAAKAVDTTA